MSASPFACVEDLFRPYSRCPRYDEDQEPAANDVSRKRPVAEQKLAIEALLGRTVSNEEAVSVRAVTPATIIPSQISSQDRVEALRRMDAYFGKVDGKRKRVTEAEEDALFTEAMRSVRPNFRPAD